MDKIRIMQWGFGAMGSGMVELISKKSTMELVAVYDKREEYRGKKVSDILKGVNLDVEIVDDPLNILDNKKIDVVIMATSSFVKDVTDDIISVVKKGVNVISIAEEMAYPWISNKDLSQKMHDEALKHKVSIVGTGINPGFVLDALIIMMTGVCKRVDRIEASRINDLSPFGPTVMETQGVGITPGEFEDGLKKGTIVGHIGFPQSISLIANVMGIELDEIKEVREPIISKTKRETKYVKVDPGMVAGCKHIGYGIKDGKKVITLIHPQQIKPEIENIETGDYINIYGDPDIKLSIKPECPGGIGTIATAVNTVPLIVEAKPGLLSILDLPLLRIAN